MPASDPTVSVYRPLRWVVASSLVAAMLFAGFAAISFATGIHLFYRYALAVGTLLAIAAVVDLCASRVVVQPDAVRIRTLFRTRCVPFDQIAEVRLDGGRTCLRLNKGGWHRLPPWLGADLGLRNRIACRLSPAGQGP